MAVVGIVYWPNSYITLWQWLESYIGPTTLALQLCILLYEYRPERLREPLRRVCVHGKGGAGVAGCHDLHAPLEALYSNLSCHLSFIECGIATVSY